jgi:hypothetical protein
MLIQGDDQAARDDHLVSGDGADSEGYRVTTVRQNIGRMFWCLAMEVMVKILTRRGADDVDLRG